MKTATNKIGKTTCPNFTNWQVAIIRHWAEQGTSEAAADNLGISVHTFQTHLKRMRAKLNVKRTFDVYLFLSKAGRI